MPETNLTYWRNKTLHVNPSDRCTNQCMFCIRNYDTGVFGFDLSLDIDPTPGELVQAIREGWRTEFIEAAIVGLGEPLLNLEGTLASVRAVKSLADVPVRINTNGQALLMYPRRDIPHELAEAGFDHVQVSLNAQDSQTYVKLYQPSSGKKTYGSMLRCAERCTKYMAVEFSVVRVPGVDVDACRRIGRRNGRVVSSQRVQGFIQSPCRCCSRDGNNGPKHCTICGHPAPCVVAAAFWSGSPLDGQLYQSPLRVPPPDWKVLSIAACERQSIRRHRRQEWRQLRSRGSG